MDKEVFTGTVPLDGLRTLKTNSGLHFINLLYADIFDISRIFLLKPLHPNLSIMTFD